jgi:hypothetical protein
MESMSLRRGAGSVLLAALLAAGLVMSVVAFPLRAAAETFEFALEKQIIRGTPGEQIDLGSRSVPESLVGQLCTVEAIGNNNRSVHPGNNIVVSSVNSVTLVGVEDARDKDTFASGHLELGDTVSFTLILGQDPTYSAEFRVVFDCFQQETTTTTVPETTTTTVAETTTTTVAETTTTTVPETTSTTVDVTTTSTTTPETTTTVQVAPTTTPSTTPDTLPFTGVESDALGIVALVALVAGSGLVLLTRKSAEAVVDRRI